MLSLRALAAVTIVAIDAMIGAMLAAQLGVWPWPQHDAVVAAPQPARLAPPPPVAVPLPRPDIAVAQAQIQKPPAQQVPRDAVAEAPPPPQNVTPDPALAGEAAGAVAARLRSVVPADLAPYFDVYLYVSKAAAGPWAQHMFVFRKTVDGTLEFEQAFAVSTGREEHEKYFTGTPAGIFELDPGRFEPMHISHTWDGAPMPWSMFLNYTIRTHLTGIALHARVDGESPLGMRASGGCVRLPLEKAEELYKRFQAGEQGMVPVFAFDETRDTTSVDGTMLRDSAGNPLLTNGDKVLLVIENDPGGAPVIATLS